MNPIIWLLAGAALGWLTSNVILRRRSSQLLYIAVGMVGALVSVSVLYPLLPFRDILPQYFSPGGLLVALAGAVFLLTIVFLLQKRSYVNNKMIESRWTQVRSKIHTRWGKLTTEDLSRIDTNHDELTRTIQERYEFSNEEVEDQIQRYLKSVLIAPRRLFMFSRS